MARTSVGLGVVLGVVFGAICGALGMHFLGSETQAGEAQALDEWVAEEPAEKPPALEDPGERAPLAEQAPEPARETVETEATGELLSPALLDYARENLVKGWAAERQDRLPEELLAEGMQRFEELVMTSPAAIGRELGVRENKREEALRDAETGGLFALLASLESGEAGPLPDLVGDSAEFEKFFQRDSNEEHAVSGIGLTPESFTSMVDGTTLTFPAGVFELEQLARYWRPVPRDITIRGSGMDATLIVYGDQHTQEQLKNFRVEDCTLIAEGGVFDLRANAATATFERVRITSFDTGAGCSCAMNANEGIAVRWIDCVFAGGFGRDPGGGNLFDVRSHSLLSRFERCRFDRMRMNFDRIQAGGTMVFSLCAFENLTDRQDPLEEFANRPGIVFEQCTARLRDESTEMRRDLNDLFPDWKAEIER